MTLPTPAISGTIRAPRDPAPEGGPPAVPRPARSRKGAEGTADSAGLQWFYFGMETSSIDRKMGHVPAILYSASLLWRPKRRTFRTPRPPDHDRLFLDSGGFSFFSRHGDYPFGAPDLAELGLRLKADAVACMDYPCESSVDRGAVRTNEDRISKTVSNARACLAIAGVPWLPVIQGSSIEEYLECIRQLESARAIRPYMGVGTLCRRVSREDTWEVLRAIRRALPDVRLHGFGVDLRLIRDRRIRGTLFSADSSAWNWTPRSLRTDPGRRFAPTHAERLRNFRVYNGKVGKLVGERTLDWWTTTGAVA